MRSIVSINISLFCACLGLSFTPLIAQALTEGDYTYTVSGTSATITDFDVSYSGPLSITNSLGGYPVTHIGGAAFASCTGLTSVVISDNVQAVGANSFEYCTGLTNVVIGKGVSSIGGAAFFEATRLSSVYFNATNCAAVGLGGSGNYQTYIFGKTEPNVCGIQVTIGKDAGQIPSHLFEAKECNTAGQLVLDIDGKMISYQGDISSVVFEHPSSCSAIGESAFAYNPNLTVVALPASVTSIKDSAFASCTGLTSVIISDNVQAIGNSAFASCTALTNVVIGKGVSSIGGGAFFGATRLASVYFNATNCTTIIAGSSSIFGTFEPNACGIQVTIGKDAKQIPYNLFNGSKCKNGFPVMNPDGSLMSFKGDISSVVFEAPSSCSSIGDWAFAYNPRLTNMSIPASVREIGELAFWSCTNLTSMTLPGDIRPEGANFLEAVTILEGSINIGEGIFSQGMPLYEGGVLQNDPYDSQPFQTTFSKLNVVTIPESVTSIGAKAFMDCTSLSSITIPSGVTTIGYSAFSGCSSLASVRLLDSPTTIGNFAFMNCTNLSSAILGDKVEDIDSSAFDHCTKIPSIIIPSSTKHIAPYAFSDCWSLTTVIIPDTISSVADYAFYNCPALKTVFLPSSILPLRRIFSDYENITTVTVGHTATNIPDYAFADCTSLTSVTLPNQIQTIGYAAFFNCISLQTVALPSSLVSLGDWSFSCCSSLESISLPESLTLIGSRAFSYCDSLTSLTIPKTVTQIGDFAFAWSPSLTAVNFLGDTPQIGEDIYSAQFSTVVSHIMPWATGWGSVFAERPVERSTAQLYAPLITPSNGHVFQTGCSILISQTAYSITPSSNTCPATLRYTQDGSDPTPSSPIYSRFSVTNNAVIKARFFGNEDAFSEVATVRLFKGTYDGAMDLPHALNFDAPTTISTNAGWFAQTRVTHDGQAAAQSGQILDNGESLFTLPLQGPGQVSFQWKTSCEKDDTGAMNWDYASVTLDGIEISRLDGETDWTSVSFAIPEGTHEISIFYRKDEVLAAGEDCVWVDDFAFMPSSPLQFSMGGESFKVPVSTNFTRNATQQIIDSAVATYTSAFPSAKPEDIQSLLSTADAMGLNMGLLGQGTNILLFSPQITISEIQFSYQGAPAETPPNQVAITFTLKNNITTPEEAVALLESSASRRLEVLARAQLSGSIATIIPVSTQFSGDTITLTFQLLAAPAEAFFRIRLAHQLD